MWLLSSRNRPKDCAEAVESFIAQASNEFELTLWIDGDISGYEEIEGPGTVIHTPHGEGLSYQMNRVFEMNPDASFYGWLADDFRAKSADWDKRLADMARQDTIAFGFDEWKRGYKPDMHITSAFAVGGGLVRAAGWFAPPELKQAGIDSAWNKLGRELGLMRYDPEVIVEHLHWKNKKRPQDNTDNVTEQRNLGVKVFRDYIRAGTFSGARYRVRKYLESNHYPVHPEKRIKHDGGDIRRAWGVDGNMPSGGPVESERILRKRGDPVNPAAALAG